MNTPVCDITPKELNERLTMNENLFILDVREPEEFEICHINGTLIPLSQLQERIEELDKNAVIVVHCKSGGRSLKAAEILLAHGFKKVFNLLGGILAWIDEIDPNLQRY